MSYSTQLNSLDKRTLSLTDENDYFFKLIRLESLPILYLIKE